MKLVLTLLVRDEIDIISSSIDYHLSQGIDRIIVTDNGSRDGTLEVLFDLAQRNAIELLQESPDDFSQHRWVTAMARMAHDKYGAHWVINADADEFFVCRGVRLREALGSVAADASRLLVSRHDFVSFDRPCTGVPPLEMVYRKAGSLGVFGSELPPKVIHRAAPDVIVAQGNHEAKSAHFQAPPVPSNVEIFHFPIRSVRQFESKVRNAGSGYARNQDLPATLGHHKRHWYDLLLSGSLREEYAERLHFGATRLKAGLASGELVEDRTLAERLA